MVKHNNEERTLPDFVILRPLKLPSSFELESSERRMKTDMEEGAKVQEIKETPKVEDVKFADARIIPFKPEFKSRMDA